MHRSNLTRLLLGVLFILLLALAWLWHQNVSARLQWWASWTTFTYGCAAGFWIWLHGLRLSRLIHDIPTSRIATAAQGYVELFGRAVQFEDQRARALLGATVLWYRKEYAERGAGAGTRAFPFNVFYVPVEVEESRTPFAVDDETGRACILPHGAQIICARKQVRYEDNRRVTEEKIVPGDPLYVVGEFSTYALQPESDRAAYELTRQWEQDSAKRRAYDVNRDGKLSQAEWLAMHADACAAVISESMRAAPSGSPHLVFKPADGRPYLISSLPPEKLGGRYRIDLLLGFALFVGCGTVSLGVLFGKLVS
jgi:hypothetical protein